MRRHRTRRPLDAPAFSPGPLDSSMTASSFALSPASSMSPWSATSLSDFAPSPPVSHHAERYSVVSPGRVPAPIRSLTNNISSEARPRALPLLDLKPPEDPIRYLLKRPWAFGDYLHLLSLAATHHPTSAAGWERMAIAQSAASSIHRSAWDCWHRWTVPWAADGPDDAHTYPNIPGVKYRYRHIDVDIIMDLYVLVTGVVGVAENVPRPEPTVPVVQHAMRRHHCECCLSLHDFSRAHSRFSLSIPRRTTERTHAYDGERRPPGHPPVVPCHCRERHCAANAIRAQGQRKQYQNRRAPAPSTLTHNLYPPTAEPWTRLTGLDTQVSGFGLMSLTIVGRLMEYMQSDLLNSSLCEFSARARAVEGIPWPGSVFVGL
jgi:hypothetical protein